MNRYDFKHMQAIWKDDLDHQAIQADIDAYLRLMLPLLEEPSGGILRQYAADCRSHADAQMEKIFTESLRAGAWRDVSREQILPECPLTLTGETADYFRELCYCIKLRNHREAELMRRFFEKNDFPKI